MLKKSSGLMGWVYVLVYLAAIVAANLLIGKFGTSAVYVVAFTLVGLDITARDKLHEAWHNQGLAWKMCLLILAGSGISYLLNNAVLQIAIASTVAFAVAALGDTIAYQFLYDKNWYVKVNGSNLVSSALDSLIFPTVAFGAFMPVVVLGQFAAKFLGGFVWAFVIGRLSKK